MASAPSDGCGCCARPGRHAALESIVQEDARPLDIGPREAWDSHSWNSDWWRDRGRALFERWPMVVRLSDRVDVEWFKQVGPAGWAGHDEVDVSGIGTIAAARVTPRDAAIEPFVVVSMYGDGCRRTRPRTGHRCSTRTPQYTARSQTCRPLSGYEDSRMHRILAAGDLNLVYGYAEGGMNEKARTYWAGRYATVLTEWRRWDCLSWPSVSHGRQADPWPDELPLRAERAYI